MVKAGTILFAASPDDDPHIAEARAWITDHALTAADVALAKVGGCVIVRARREVTLKEREDG